MTAPRRAGQDNPLSGMEHDMNDAHTDPGPAGQGGMDGPGQRAWTGRTWLMGAGALVTAVVVIAVALWVLVGRDGPSPTPAPATASPTAPDPGAGPDVTSEPTADPADPAVTPAEVGQAPASDQGTGQQLEDMQVAEAWVRELVDWRPGENTSRPATDRARALMAPDAFYENLTGGVTDRVAGMVFDAGGTASVTELVDVTPPEVYPPGAGYVVLQVEVTTTGPDGWVGPTLHLVVELQVVGGQVTSVLIGDGGAWTTEPGDLP